MPSRWRFGILFWVDITDESDGADKVVKDPGGQQNWDVFILILGVFHDFEGYINLLLLAG